MRFLDYPIVAYVIDNKDINTHAINSYPNECCGLVYNNKYHPCDNIHEQPDHNFAISREDLFKAYNSTTGLQSIIHSHTNLNNITPSYNDMTQQIATNVPWGVLTTNGRQVSQILYWPEDLSTDYHVDKHIFGIHDCYTLVRKWYYQHMNIKLNEVARCIDYWERGLNIMEESYSELGFCEVTDLKYGDLILYAMRNDFPNHVAVYLGGNKMIHHAVGRCAAEDRITKYKKYEYKYLRHESTYENS